MMASGGVTIEHACERAAKRLAQVADQALFEAQLLLAHVLKVPRAYLYSRSTQALLPDYVSQFESLVSRREQGEPVAYLLGKRAFWSLELMVTPDVLIPRPETELVIEHILEALQPGHEIKLIADLGTGSGAIALSLAQERPHWVVHATDVSSAALKVAAENAAHLGIRNVSFHLGDWCDALHEEAYDVIVSNPPYLSEAEWPRYAESLAFEPRSALVSGADGLDAIKAIVRGAKKRLKPGGLLYLEHGYQQGEAVADVLGSHGYSGVVMLTDLAGLPRVTKANLPS